MNTDPHDAEPLDEEDILVVRRGPGANCSSIGSALDILFLTATAAGVVLAMTAAALSAKRERAREAGDEGRAKDGPVAREG